MFLNLSETSPNNLEPSKSGLLGRYSVTKTVGAGEKFQRVRQISRAKLSVHINATEWFLRKTIAERKRLLLEVGRHSVIELDAALDLAHRFKYCTKQALEASGEDIVGIYNQLSEFINELKTPN